MAMIEFGRWAMNARQTLIQSFPTLQKIYIVAIYQQLTWAVWSRSKANWIQFKSIWVRVRASNWTKINLFVKNGAKCISLTSFTWNDSAN